jgi:hypothetical protein
MPARELGDCQVGSYPIAFNNGQCGRGAFRDDQIADHLVLIAETAEFPGDALVAR